MDGERLERGSGALARRCDAGDAVDLAAACWTRAGRARALKVCAAGEALPADLAASLAGARPRLEPVRPDGDDDLVDG